MTKKTGVIQLREIDKCAMCGDTEVDTLITVCDEGGVDGAPIPL